MKNILVVNVNWLGDVIFSSPVFKSLKETYPEAKITCMAVPRVREILECTPCIDEIINYDEEGAHNNPLAKINLIWQIRKHKFDIAFLLHRSLTRALLVYLAGIPQRVGYDTKGRGPFLTHKISSEENSVHRSDYYLKVIETYGVKVHDRKTNLEISEESSQEADLLLKKHNVQKKDSFVVVHPAANWSLKRWPKENFRSLIKHLVHMKDSKVVVTGTKEDRGLIQEITAGITPLSISMAGEMNLKQLAALLKRADCLICADSGPVHIAHSVGTPVVGIFGPTRIEITGPRGSARSAFIQHDVGCNRRPCYFLECPDNICMQAVTVQNVIDAIRKIQNS